MFRKKKDLNKTPSIIKKSPVGSPGAHNPSLSVVQEQPCRDGSDVSSPTPTLDVSSSPVSSLSLHSKLSSCPSPVSTLRRPTTLSRHASAAGFSIQSGGSWSFNKNQGRSPTPECAEGIAIEVEDIPALLRHVARFAEAVEKLKDVVLGDDKQESRQPQAHECLGEVLRILRQVISTYPLLNTVETLTAAGTLISKVKGFHYENNREADKKDFEKAIETMAVAFSSSVSELLMGEVDSSTLLSLPPTEKSRSMENLYAGAAGQTGDAVMAKSDLQECVTNAKEVDIILQRSEGGVESALGYAKSISKYMKDVISYVDKRVALEMEFAKGLQRLHQSCKHSIAQPHMPFFSIYSLALDQDQEQSQGFIQAFVSVYTQTFLQPLTHRKQEHEKLRKDIKEQWQRAKKKLIDAETNLRKAKHTYVARCEEYDKAKAVVSRAGDEQQGSGSSGRALDKKKRLEEEARNKAEEAEATYRTCIADATTQHQELEDVKVNVLSNIQQVIRQSERILRACTISYYQSMHMQTAALPVHYQTLCESSKLYDPGQQYATHVRYLQMPEEPETYYTFQPYNQSVIRARHDSVSSERQSSTESEPVCDTLKEKQRRAWGQQVHRSWPSAVSDTDSVGGDGGMDSPGISSGDITQMGRTLSTGTMSSTEELCEKDTSDSAFVQRDMNGMEADIPVPTGPFRNIGLSKAAQTHRLRKLRTPSKCRECDSYVYFQGAECEECFLACHKKCLECLAIQCGHKKLQGRLQLFGRDFSLAPRGSAEGVPFIITKCILEIERRALKMKGIYRVNGVKTRVEKLCQAFENGKELVELSQASPHDISNVLKLYLRQLPEPIMPFRVYNELMGLAKESLCGDGPELHDLGPNTEPEVVALAHGLRALVEQLPGANVSTLRYITQHLCRISALEQENKMSPSNLGIVFGPTLMRPRPTGGTVSLSSLVDYPHQARVVEALIVFYTLIFTGDSAPATNTRTADTNTECRRSQECEAELQCMQADTVDVQESCGNTLGGGDYAVESDSDADDPVNELASVNEDKQESETSTEDEQLEVTSQHTTVA